MTIAWFLLFALLETGPEPLSLERVNAGIQRVLDAAVSEDGTVDYSKLKGSEELRQALDDYVAFTASFDPASVEDKHQKIAILANAYNVWTLAGVVKAWPVDSVRDIRPLFGFFTKDEWTLGGEEISLNKLEKIFLRPLDPRVHFIINCASASCPVLPRKVLTAENVEAEMEAAARRFLGEEPKNRFDKNKRQWRLSKIFKWYQEDWGKQADVVAFIRQYRPDLDWTPKKINYLDYDWALNGPTH